MAAAIEIEIQHMLNQFADERMVAEKLCARWSRNLFDLNEQATVAQFLLNAGLISDLLKQCGHLARINQPLPWPQFLLALIETRANIDEEMMAAIMEGLDVQNGWFEAVRATLPQDWPAPFHLKRAEMQSQRMLAVEEKRSSLRLKLDLVRSQRMLSEEGKALAEMRRFFPDDESIQDQAQSFAERIARDVIASHTSITDLSEQLEQTPDVLSPEQISLKGVIAERCRVLAQENPNRAYDLSLLLFGMEFYNDAIDVLAIGESTPAMDWFSLELMIRARRFVDALDSCSRLELKFAGEPNAAFAIAYARARGLWGLGQSSMAIDLMRSIVRIRPSYRSAHSLLLDWTGGDL